MIDTTWAIDWLDRCADVLHDRRAELTELDRAIGDADHGENLDRGFQAVRGRLDPGEFDTPGQVLMMAAKTLISTVGGASGPLYGTALLRAAKAAPGDELDAAGVAALLAAACQGIQSRGKAERGEKTMVDAWGPAADAAVGAESAVAALRAAADAAERGAEETTGMRATKGRASYLGERSVGHKDPGAASTALILRAAADAAADAAGRDAS
ncbi:dihydroxyacetone kinase subunit DhaL [Corynebacterium uterequi]|uniref:Dihydroxyacetone kinase DhaL subunit n=1 Tax=Corynebacterium uterequi TaxID=1072256 RepID=A0A0G3HCC0_9CORY|nr:dihydroxyacetone kinase subunit DhaL [Corynebacterium uterequi]AKK10944.1 dihydroxyacetone kinase DhaL subunit [Corynebacterium uterequi]